MKRPTKDQAEGLAILAVMLGGIGLSLWRHGLVRTIALLVVVLLTFVLLTGVTKLARRLGR